ncbi:MAG: SH3 domain-containing protein [Clostridia bacterium]|nr:SH3 domain-containing protein [Clostridia bacterium]
MRKRLPFLILILMAVLMIAVPAALAAGYDTGVINSDGVSFREGPSTDSGRISKLKEGTTVQILSTNVNAEWHKVEVNGKTGYVNRMYVTLKNASDGDTLLGYVVNVKSNVNVRSSASSDSELLGRADLGSSYTLKSSTPKDGWYAVDYHGHTGYIKKDYLQIAKKATSKQLSSISIKGGELSPEFSPDVYGYVVTADRADITISVTSPSKVSVGDSGKNTLKISLPKTGTKTVRISVGGKTKYSLYIVRNVITVGTYNIKRGNGNLTSMGKMIQEQNPDIMGIQEVYRTAGKINNLLSLRTKHMQYVDFARTISYNGGGEYGIGVLSAYKIVSSESVSLSSGNSEPRILQKVVVSVGKRKVSVYNTHFSWDSASLRAKQFAEVKKIMKRDSNKYKILFGDFNAKAAEFSQLGSTFQIINTKDTHFFDYDGSEIGKNEIDNIIVSTNIQVLNARMINNEYSDHKAIFAYLKFE